MIETQEHKPLAYLEVQESSLLVSEPDEVARLQRRYAMIRTQAREPEESAALIEELANDHD